VVVGVEDGTLLVLRVEVLSKLTGGCSTCETD